MAIDIKTINRKHVLTGDWQQITPSDLPRYYAIQFYNDTEDLLYYRIKNDTGAPADGTPLTANSDYYSQSPTSQDLLSDIIEVKGTLGAIIYVEIQYSQIRI